MITGFRLSHKNFRTEEQRTAKNVFANTGLMEIIQHFYFYQYLYHRRSGRIPMRCIRKYPNQRELGKSSMSDKYILAV